MRNLASDVHVFPIQWMTREEFAEAYPRVRIGVVSGLPSQADLDSYAQEQDIKEQTNLIPVTSEDCA